MSETDDQTKMLESAFPFTHLDYGYRVAAGTLAFALIGTIASTVAYGLPLVGLAAGGAAGALNGWQFAEIARLSNENKRIEARIKAQGLLQKHS